MFCRFPAIISQIVVFNRCFLLTSINHQAKQNSSAVDLSYKIIGIEPGESDKPPICILHGLLSNKKNWQGLGKVLVKVTKRCVIAVDLRNHGWSPHASPHSYEALASDIIKLLVKLSLKKASLVGHSMGGRTAMAMALMQPASVENLIVLDISPISSTTQLDHFFPKVLSRMKTFEFHGLNTVSDARIAVRKHLQDVIKHEGALNTMLFNVNKKRNGKIGWICNLDVLINDFQYIAEFPHSMRKKSFPGPTLFIGGQFSEFIPADDLTGIRELFPRAMVKYIPKAGHYVHLDNPASFLQLVISFLRINE